MRQHFESGLPGAVFSDDGGYRRVESLLCNSPLLHGNKLLITKFFARIDEKEEDFYEKENGQQSVRQGG